jgi:predicted ATPase
MEGTSQPSGTVTLVFTDIQGSTRLLAELGELRYLEALTEHREVVRGAFGRHGGYEVDTQGDSFFYAFPYASGAVGAIEEAMAALEGGPVAIRVGVHTGEPGLDGRNYVGLDVHKAARIMSAGHGGQVVVSQPTSQLLDGPILRDLGEHRLKDFDAPVRLYQLGSVEFPPLKTLNNTNLPIPGSSFLGRDRELSEVASLLRGHSSRLITLTGPGGSGKTRLAIEAAADALGEFPDGVFWVGLASLGESALVVETIGRTLRATNGLAEQIGDRSLLLLLDNFEHVIDAATELSALLGACPSLRILVTSRELLRLQAEVEYPVPPLTAPEAEELFCLRARLPIDEDIADLCRRLDDLPLALELAAARTAVLSPAEIRDRLSRRLDLFRGGRDADPRQQTLRATIEWSYDLLSEPERQLFAHLSVFTGGCTLDAAEEVIGADVDTLQGLVEKSLLRRSGGRFWMLETIRELAHERLQESTDADELRFRHAEWFLSLAERAEPGLKSADQPFWLERLEDEHDNLRASLDWLLDHGESELALRLAAALFLFWYTHGHVAEGRRWLRRALEAAPDAPSEARARALDGAGYLANEQGDYEEAIGLVEASLACAKEVGATSTAALAAAHVATVLGSSRSDATDPQAVVAVAEEGVALAREAGDDWALALALNCLGVATADLLGDVDRATVYYEESLGLRRRLGDKSRVALALNNLAWVALVGHDYTHAAALYAEVVEIAAAIGDKRHLGIGHVGLAEVAYLEGRWGEAAEHARESLRFTRELGMKLQMLQAIFYLAGVAAATGYMVRAARLAAAAEQQLSLIAPGSNFADQLFHQANIENAKAAAGPQIWEQASAAGRAMSLAAAVDDALSPA